MQVSRRMLFPLWFASRICGAAQDPPWRARVAEDNEPGERLIIRGRVLRTAGGVPAAGTAIIVYQTDAGGIYSPKDGHPRETARLRGRFVTGANGEYEIVTIRPGQYPGGGTPAHIHVNLMESGKEPREIFEFFFAGDRYLKGGEQGYVLRLNKDARGVWQAVQDVALSR